MITMVSLKQFGDTFQHEPQTALTMLAHLLTIKSRVDPDDDIQAYSMLAKPKKGFTSEVLTNPSG